jgi:hypothetical protein
MALSIFGDILVGEQSITASEQLTCGSADLGMIDALLVSVQRNGWNTVPLACFTWVFTLTPDS